MKLKTPVEIDLMRQGGAITAQALATVISASHPGVSLLELDHLAEEVILAKGALPSFKTVAGYRHTTCLNINKGVVHGVPSGYTLRAGDILSVDLGTFYKGFHTDAAWSVMVGEDFDDDKRKFLVCGELALNKGIDECQQGNYLSAISRAIQTTIEGSGYSVSRDLVGHGVGRNLHEDPQVPGFVDDSAESEELKVGMVLAIEVIYMQGGYPIVEDRDDRWTISTADGSIAALFEHTVAITEKGPVVLTK